MIISVRMKNLIIFLATFCLILSCHSEKSRHSPNQDSDIISDIDNISDVDLSDDTDILSDKDNSDLDKEADDSSMDDDLSDSDLIVDDSDSDTDIKTCVFCPKETGLLCSGLPEEIGGSKMLYNSVRGEMIFDPKVSKNWIIFTYSTESGFGNYYGCNLNDNKIYRLTNWTNVNMFHNRYSLHNDFIFAETWDSENGGSDKSLLILYDLSKWDFKIIKNQNEPLLYPSIYYPYLSFSNSSSFKVFVDNIETENEREVVGIGGISKIYKDKILINGSHKINYESYNTTDIINSTNTLWLGDIETLNMRPLVVTEESLLSKSYISKNYIGYLSGSDVSHVGLYDYSGASIYLYDIKNKREIGIETDMDKNYSVLDMNYPYIAIAHDWDGYTARSKQTILNIETGESWEISDYDIVNNWDVAVFNDNYLISISTYDDIYSFKLPELPSAPEKDDCDDGNPCTDDRWIYSESKCEFTPNHDRCSSGNFDNSFEVCINSECKSVEKGIDSVEMITVPEGEFYFGSDIVTEDEDYRPIKRPWEGPRRKHYLPEFQTDKYEVTISRYKQCVTSGACAAPKKVRSGWRKDYYNNAEFDNYPVIYVDWFEAGNYCEWVGKRLPTEAEWSKAARGMEDGRKYGWGNDLTEIKGNVEYDFTEKYDTAAVGSFVNDISYYGVMDMHGNVGEWTTSPWTPEGLDGKINWGEELPVIKGGHWQRGWVSAGWIDYRRARTPRTAASYLGFRCVR